jgi:pilus assembly protein Flp/PilA
MMALYTRLLLKLRSQSGQGLVEYGLVLVLVSVVLIGALMALSGQINTVYANIVSGLQGSNP